MAPHEYCYENFAIAVTGLYTSKKKYNTTMETCLNAQ